MNVIQKILVVSLGMGIFNLSYIYLHMAGFSKKTKLILMITGNIVLLIAWIFFSVRGVI